MIDAHVCECCPTAAAVTSEGIITAYRNRSDDEIRDNYVARLVNGKWTTPQPVFNDNWKIAACPVNGPSLSANGSSRRDGLVHRQERSSPGLCRVLADAGKTFSSPIRIDDGGTLGRVDLEMLPDGSALATWIEFATVREALQADADSSGPGASKPNGTRSAPVTIAGIAGSRSSGYPRAAVANGEVVFAWTESAEGGGLQVRTAAASLTLSRRAHNESRSEGGMKKLLRVIAWLGVPRDRRRSPA